MYAFAKLHAAFCPFKPLPEFAQMSDHEIVFFSSCTKSLRSFCLAVTLQKSETLNQASNQDTQRLYWLQLAVATKIIQNVLFIQT